MLIGDDVVDTIVGVDGNATDGEDGADDGVGAVVVSGDGDGVGNDGGGDDGIGDDGDEGC